MEYITVGKLNKSFGTKGEIKVVPLKAYASDLRAKDVWFISKGSEVIPYFVEYLNEETHFLVKFEDVNAPEIAKNITGCPIQLRAKDITIQNEDPENDLDKLVGFAVIAENSIIGTINEIEEYPQQLMAFVQLEDEEKQIMIPLSPDFIQFINIETREIEMVLPEGLLDI